MSHSRIESDMPITYFTTVIIICSGLGEFYGKLNRKSQIFYCPVAKDF